MTTRSTIVRQSELLNLLLLDRTTMEEMGHVETLWMYPQKHRVLGLISKSGFLGTKKAAFNLAQLDTLGDGSILVTSKPEPTDAKKVQQLESLIHTEVWTDAGSRVGEIVDCLFNLRTGVISNYLFIVNRWRGLTDGVYLLPPSQILSAGKKRVLVADAAVKTLQVHSQGLRQQVSRASSAIKQDYVNLTDDMQTAAKQAQAKVEQTGKTVQSITMQATARATSILQQAKQKAQQFGEQLTEQLNEQWSEPFSESPEELVYPDYPIGDDPIEEPWEQGLSEDNPHDDPLGSTPSPEASPDHQPNSVEPRKSAIPMPPAQTEPPQQSATPRSQPESFADWDSSDVLSALDSPDILKNIPPEALDDDDPWV